MKKKNLTIVLVSLLLGAIIGVSILGIKSVIRNNLVEMLDDMARRGAGCSFEYDRVSISLLTLTARAVNPRIVCDGKGMFGFENLRARFSLDRINEHEVMLTELTLRDGYSVGATSESPTYKFIDFLVAPLDASKDYPGRWKLRLYNLKIRKGSFTEKIGTTNIRGEDVNLDLSRTPENNFYLAPSIGKISFANDKNSLLAISNLSSKIGLLDEEVNFRDISVNSNQSRITGAADLKLKPEQKLSGSLETILSLNDFGLPVNKEATLQGSAKISSNESNVTIAGSLQKGEANLKWETPQITIENIATSFEIITKDGSLLIHTSTNATGPGFELNSIEPMSISPSQLSGQISTNIGTLSLAGISADNIKAILLIQGTPQEPSLSATLNAQFLGTFGNYIRSVSGQAQYAQKGIKLNLQNEDGSFKISSKFSPPENGKSRIEEMSFRANSVPLVRKDILGEAIPSPLALTAEADFTGYTEIETLRGAIHAEAIQISSQDSVITVKGSLDNGRVTANASTSSNNLLANIESNLISKSGTIKVTLNDFSPQEIDSQVTCAHVTGSLNYTFTESSSTGELALQSVSLGCDPYTLNIDQPRKFKISDNNIELGQLRLLGRDNVLNVRGSIGLKKGYDIIAEGSLNLISLAPLIPAIDDLKGDVSLKLNISGKVSKPIIAGKTTLTSGSLVLQSADLSIDDVSGTLDLSEDKITLSNFHGQANDGLIEVNGSIDLKNSTGTSIILRITDIGFQPMQDAIARTSGEIILQPEDDSSLGLSGTLVVNYGEIQRSLTLRSLLQSFISSTQPSESSSVGSSAFDGIKLNISVQAPRNLFLLSNWSDVEMMGNVLIGGTIKEPIIKGQIEALSGWFGLRSRRFSISSGKLSVGYPTQEPIIDLTAETQVPSVGGESVLVMLDVSGPLSNPRIKFTSDSGLPEQELTKLITKGGFAVSGSLLDVMTVDEKLVGDSATSSFLRFLHRLTQIDNFGFEPGYNERSGIVEPILIAEKNLTSRLKIIGRNSFAAESRQSGIFASLDLTPSLNVVSGFENLPLEDVAAYSIDLQYAVKKEESRLLDITVTGNKNIATREILESLRLSSDSRIPWQQSNTIIKEIKSIYKKQGYFDIIVSIHCEDDGEFCRSLNIDINEGTVSTISVITKQGDDISRYIKKAKLPSIGAIAKKSLLTSLDKSLTDALRSDGFIGASIKATYNHTPNSNNAELILTSTLGAPVTFIFSGNKAFSAEDFLNTINLFNRTQPFGKNTIFILLENIERLYREAGYLYVTIDRNEIESEDEGRIIHRIAIDEGSKVKVRSIVLNGTSPFSLEEYTKSLSYQKELIEKRFTKPEYALQEDIDYFAAAMVSLLKDRGYPDANVVGSIIPVSDNTVDIAYEFMPNQRLVFDKVNILGWPGNLPPPTITQPPYSVPYINRLVDEVQTSLKRSGYFMSSVTTEPTATEISIIVTSAEPTTISEIYIIGSANVSDDVIRDHLGLSVGNIWTEESLNLAKRQLLRLGLFSRVDILPADGNLDGTSEPIMVRVEERGLRPLDLGIGYNSAYGVHLFGEYIDRKLFADGRSLGLRVDTYQDTSSGDVSKGTISLRFIDPLLTEKGLRWTEEARFQKLKNGVLPFDVDRLSLLSFLDLTLTPTLKTALGHTLMSEDLSDVEADAVLSPLDSGSNLLSIISGSITKDKRNDALIPSKGYLVATEASLSEKYLGSDARYAGIGGRASIYVPLNHDSTLTFAQNLRLGALFPIGDTKEIPISQRFFLGGHNTVRGFRENSVGPRGEDGTPTGGDLLGYTNIELQYLVTDYLQLATFFDAGTTTIKSQSSSIHDIRESAGVATRVLTPLGAISLDLGFPLDERQGESSVRLHFNIGAQF